MAKTVTMEWTDAQWALLVQYLPTQVGSYIPADDTWTEEAVGAAYQRHIALHVQQGMRNNLLTTTEFDSLFVEEG